MLPGASRGPVALSFIILQARRAAWKGGLAVEMAGTRVQDVDGGRSDWVCLAKIVLSGMGKRVNRLGGRGGSGRGSR